MKKLILILLTFMSFTSLAQMQVKENSFRQIDGFVMLDKNEHYDDNNQPMALIKISTENITAEERRRITFKGNLATYFDVHFEPTEIHLYISAQAATFIEIHHPDYGKTEFILPFDLKDFCGYEMVLQYVPIVGSPNIIKPQNTYLVITSDQDNAIIYIDDKFVGTKVVSKSFDIGTTHTWKIECNMYHTESGTVTLNDKTIISKNLRPNFGYISVTSSPENGAKVFVDGNYIGETPCKTDRLKSGSHSVKVMKEMYNSTEKSIVVNDGQTTNANIEMSVNFVNVTINTDADSDIYVDEELKGKGSWTGRLSEGSHYLEARKPSHETIAKNINLIIGKNETITLEAPKPICGFLDISTTPIMVEIYIDGKHYGQTPSVINDLLVGEHELKLEKSGCASVTKNITIEEGKVFIFEETLESEYVMQDEYTIIHYKDIKDAETKLMEYYEERKQKQVEDICYEWLWHQYFPYQMFTDLIKNDRRTIVNTFNFEEIETISSDDGNVKLYKWHLWGGSSDPFLSNGVLSVKNGDNYIFYNSYKNDNEYYLHYSLEISLYTYKIKDVEMQNGKKVYLAFWRNGYSDGVESYVLDEEKGIVKYPIFFINGEMKCELEHVTTSLSNDCHGGITQGEIEWSEQEDIHVHLPNGYKEIYHSDGYRYELKGIVYDERIPLYEELRDFKSNIVVLDFSPFLVRIDKMPNGNYRYASWHEKEMSEKPNLVINNSLSKTTKVEVDKGGLYSEKIEYVFTNGEYQYIVSYYLIQFNLLFREIPKSLVVKCNGKTIKTIIKEDE